MIRSLLIVTLLFAAPQEAAKTGPGTEKRFPPLKVPPGFQATLFASDPLGPHAIAPLDVLFVFAAEDVGGDR